MYIFWLHLITTRRQLNPRISSILISVALDVLNDVLGLEDDDARAVDVANTQATALEIQKCAAGTEVVAGHIRVRGGVDKDVVNNTAAV